MGSIFNDTSIAECLSFKSLCDQLLLHDQILIPTQDYLTAAGLIRILGEHNFLTLLDEQRFIRMRGIFGYVRGDGADGRLFTMIDPKGIRPDSSPIDQSIEAGLSLVNDECTQHRQLKELLIARSHQLELQTVLDATHKDTYNDLSQTSLWRIDYRLENPELLALPGVAKMGVRVIGPGIDLSNNVIDACLA